MSASTRTSRTTFSTVRSSAGDTVSLRCKLSPKISKVTREIRWFKGTECNYQEAYEKEGTLVDGGMCVRYGLYVSLTLRDVKVMDSGQYRCEAHGERKEEVAIIYLHVAGFKLVSRSDNYSLSQLIPGDDVTLSCHLTPKMSAVAMEIGWFKGTDCICVYQDGQVKEGKGYEGRVSLFTHELEEGNVSLMLRNVQESDIGRYRCKVAHGRDKVENAENRLDVSELKLVNKPDRSLTFWMPKTSVGKPYTIYAWCSDDATLPCYLSPERTAVAMRIRWFKGTDCICLYQHGQVKEGNGYEGRVSLLTQELEKGNVSLMLRNVQKSDAGDYKCEVIHKECKVENSVFLQNSVLKPIPKPDDDQDMTETSIAKPYTIHAFAGDDVTLPCYLFPKKSAVAMEIKWFKGTDCICVYQHGQVKEGKGYEGKASLLTHELEEGNVSLMLSNVLESDGGQYKCEVTHEEYKVENSGVDLQMSVFKLIHKPAHSFTFSMTETSIAKPYTIHACAGDDVTLPCYLFPKKSAIAMEIKWFKGTDCICVYQHGQVKEGKGYEGKASLLTHELEEGNVSLMLRNVLESDGGQYKCEVTHEEYKVENSGVDLQMSELKLIHKPAHSFTFSMTETSITKPYIIYGCAGDDVTLPCYLTPKRSAVAMEIRWFKETDCICLYQNGQVKEGKGYEGRVSLFTHELENGNVSLMLRNVQKSDSGDYKCMMTRREHKMENRSFYLQMSEFKVVHRSEDVGKPFGSDNASHWVTVSKDYDATLSCYLSPKMSAVAMEIRWFKKTDCICLYQNRQVKEGKGYKGRVSLFTHELEEGNLSLMLRNVQWSDVGEYKCEVTCRDEKVEASIAMSISQTLIGIIKENDSSDDDTPKKPVRRWSMTFDFPSKKPGRRWSNPGDVPNM